MVAIVIRRGDVFVVQFFKDQARLGVVVRADLWRRSENVTLCQLTGSDQHFNLARSRVKVRDRAGTGTVEMVVEVDRLQTLPLARIGKYVDHLTVAEMRAIDDGLRLWLDLPESA